MTTKRWALPKTKAEPPRGEIGVLLNEDQWYNLLGVYRALRAVAMDLDEHNDTSALVDMFFNSLRDGVMRDIEEARPDYFIREDREQSSPVVEILEAVKADIEAPEGGAA